jgi:hypothetical protein
MERAQTPLRNYARTPASGPAPVQRAPAACAARRGAGRSGTTWRERVRAAVTCRGAPTRPPQMHPRTRQLAAQCAGAARALSGPAQKRGSRTRPQGAPPELRSRGAARRLRGGGHLQLHAAAAAVEQMEEGRRRLPYAHCKPPAGQFVFVYLIVDYIVVSWF